jgi:hypothetical protein
MIKRNIQAPLSRHLDKFKRSYFVSKKRFSHLSVFVLPLLQALYIWLLLAIDLVLFAASGNLDIFNAQSFMSPEVIDVLLMLLGCSILLIGALYRFPKVRIGVCSLATFWFIVVLFKQFSQFDHHTFLGNYLRQISPAIVPDICFSKSHIILALLLSVSFALAALKVRKIVFATYVMLFAFAFIGILHHEYKQTNDQHDFLEIRYMQPFRSNEHGKQKFVYFMLPNLSSYKYFKNFSDADMQQTSQMISGFLAKNKFAVYPNSYNPADNTFSNMVKAVNPFDDQAAGDHVMETMMIYKYWKFFNIGDRFVLLKDNDMFDTFRQADYGISAYKSRGVDICHKKYGFNVDRCIEKLNRPVNLYHASLPLSDRVKLLLVEWLNSMEMFKNLSFFYRALSLFTQPEDMPMIGIDYNNLYVVNSINTFDILAHHILTDQGRQAYFVYADIPSDMFVYDQFCKIKPQEDWISLKNLPWVDVDKTATRRQAYADQTRCLYGKLQEFLDKLDKSNLLKDTVVVINSMSGTNNFQAARYDDYTDNMFFNHMSMLAIKAPDYRQINIQEQICPSESVLNHYLYRTPLCQEFQPKGIHISQIQKLEKKLADLSVSEEEARADIPVFNIWYNVWRSHNRAGLTPDVAGRIPTQMRTMRLTDTIPTIQNETLKADLPQPQDPKVEIETDPKSELEDTAEIMPENASETEENKEDSQNPQNTDDQEEEA